MWSQLLNQLILSGKTDTSSQKLEDGKDGWSTLWSCCSLCALVHSFTCAHPGQINLRLSIHPQNALLLPKSTVFHGSKLMPRPQRKIKYLIQINWQTMLSENLILKTVSSWLVEKLITLKSYNVSANLKRQKESQKPKNTRIQTGTKALTVQKINSYQFANTTSMM